MKEKHSLKRSRFYNIEVLHCSKTDHQVLKSYINLIYHIDFTENLNN